MIWRTVSVPLLLVGLLPCMRAAPPARTPIRGGRLVIAQKAEPKTLNPLLSRDIPSREVIGRLSADLITIDRQTQSAKPVLAESWHVSPDGLHYTIKLRPNLRFSDGQPFDADDVVFSFTVFLDDKAHAVQRDPLIINGKPLSVVKLDARTLRIDLPALYAPAERIFDSVPMLPRHLLEQPYRDGKLSQVWNLNTKPDAIAGMGPFRVKEYQAGEHILLERNPYYWKPHQPYLDELEFLFVGDEDAQIARFVSGETDILNRVSARNVGLLRARGINVQDLGPSLEYNVLVFNLTPQASPAAKEWFQQKSFRQAVSVAIDRASIVQLVYGGLASPLVGHVSPGNRAWVNTNLPPAKQSIERARQLLKSSGFTWNDQGELHDRSGRRVEFTIATAASNQERSAMAPLIQDDLKKLGMKVEIATLEFRSMVDRVLNTHQYDTAIMGLGGGDPDPEFESNVWRSDGGMHIWNPGETSPGSAWEMEIDKLMNQQAVERSYDKRRKLYDQVQQIVADEVPLICLASPHVLVAARPHVQNFRPVIFDHYTLWNADELFIEQPKAKEQPTAR